jgi:hypothetical protein
MKTLSQGDEPLPETLAFRASPTIPIARRPSALSGIKP